MSKFDFSDSGIVEKPVDDVPTVKVLLTPEELAQVKGGGIGTSPSDPEDRQVNGQD